MSRLTTVESEVSRVSSTLQSDGFEKPEAKSKKLSICKVPKSLYKKALMEIEREDYSPIRSLCHSTSDQYFNCLENPNSVGMLTQGMKQALEDRNFKVLYDIINKALELKNPQMLKTIHEYMFIAISHDPMIEDKKTTLKNFCLRVKQLQTDAECESFLKNMHSFAEPDEPEKNEDEDDEDSDINFDNISEASFDLDVLNSLKAEMNES